MNKIYVNFINNYNKYILGSNRKLVPGHGLSNSNKIHATK